MKLIATTLVCLLSVGEPSSAQQAAAPQSKTTSTSSLAPVQPERTGAPPPNTLLDGTPLKLRLSENLSSESSKTGQQVAFETIEDMSVDGVVVIPKGSTALATVTFAEPKRRMGRGGKLDVNVDSVRLIDGEKAQLRAVRENKGGGHIGVMTTAMVATAIVFFPAAPLFLFMHGKSVEIPKGTEVTSFVDGDMTLNMAKMMPPGTAIAAPAAVVASALVTQVDVAVESNVAGADIEVDGAFVGSTPSTVSVAPGQHTISLKKKGYEDWSRTMNVSGGAVKVSAELEAKP